MEISSGDAFYSETQSSGIPIPSSLAEINFNYIETVDPKCNTVCFMKSEGNLHRNTISTNSKYICYAVKGSLVRVIYASTGDKLLLRGHESPICDMKFSTADLDLLCTIDEGNTGSNIFVWKLSKENEFTNTLVCSLPFTASCVHSHPLSPCLWTFSHESVVCLFSTSQPPSSGSRLAYDDFPVHHTFAGAVIDYSFSLDGRLLAVATNSNIFAATILMLPFGPDGLNEVSFLRSPFISPSSDPFPPSSAQLESGKGKFQPHCVVHLPSSISGLSFLPSDPTMDTWNLLTLTNSMAGTEVKPTIQVWKLEDNCSPKSLQTIICHLPRHQKASSEFAPSQIACEDPCGRYVIISDRKSNIVACLAVISDFTSYDPRRILHHCTYLDLKLPVTGLLCGMVLTQEGANVGRVQHLAITCLQDQLNGQLAVQQYHIQSRAVYPPSPLHIAGEESFEEEAEVDMEAEPPVSAPSSVETDLMKLMSDPSEESSNDTLPPPLSPPKDENILPVSSSAPPASSSSTTFTSSATGGKAGISIISNNSSSLPPGSFPDFALLPRKQESETVTPPVAAATAAALPSDSVDIGVKSKGILLNALKIRPAGETQASSNTASKIAPKDPPNAQQSTQKAEDESQGVSTSSPVTKAAINHSEAKSSFDLVNKKPEKSLQSVTATTPELQSQPLQQDSLSSKIRKVPFDLSKLMGSTSSSASTSAVANDSPQQQPQQQVPKVKEEQVLSATTEKEREEDEWEKASMTISRSMDGSECKDGNSSQPDDILQSLAQQVSAMQLTLNSLALSASDKKSGSKKGGGGSEMSSKQLSELKSGIIQEVTKGVGNLVLSSLEEHSAEAVAKILGSEQWREELSTQISSDLRTELAPFIAQTAKDSIRDSIKDNLRPTLVKAFKVAFESTIIPAYQSGTEVMFQQVQQTFETGVQTMVDENKSFLTHSANDSSALRSEIDQLRNTVSQLQAQIQELFQQQEASFEKHIVALSSGLASPNLARPALSYIALFEEGRCVDSLSVALELKNISALHWVLNQATKTDGNLFVLCEKCKEKPLLLICTMQQVTYYLSKHPAEDIEVQLGWLHALVVSIISTGDAIKFSISPKTGMSLKAVLQGILDTLTEAQRVQEPVFASLGNSGLRFQFQSISMFLLQSKFMNSK